jgi:carnitine O-acetyltransferase
MYKHEKHLPKLPVPDLRKTCERYLRSVEPLLSSIEYQHTVKCVHEFLKVGGMGEILQRRLIDRATITETSWLEDWWNDVAYLGYREPIVIHVNYFYHFMDDPYFLGQDASDIQIRRAALMIDSAWEFRELIINEKLIPDEVKGQPLCMYQYSYLFHTCRIPLLPKDQVRRYDPLKHPHIVVAKNSQFYALSMIHDNGEGSRLSVAEIERYIRR